MKQKTNKENTQSKRSKNDVNSKWLEIIMMTVMDKNHKSFKAVMEVTAQLKSLKKKLWYNQWTINLNCIVLAAER